MVILGPIERAVSGANMPLPEYGGDGENVLKWSFPVLIPGGGYRPNLIMPEHPSLASKIFLMSSLLFQYVGAYMRHAHGCVRDYDHQDRFFGRLVGRFDTGSQ